MLTKLAVDEIGRVRSVPQKILRSNVLLLGHVAASLPLSECTMITSIRAPSFNQFVKTGDGADRDSADRTVIHLAT
jgi:hypothetical protein